ncbi:MAG: polysaccharide pyruvyl transferase family protein [Silicimonas sp.]|nr:polysaccharide pyruvyl transferase family protein [Silicimonas sp.]
MKVGILTLPLVDNFGGILQAAALYRVLSVMGHHPVLLKKKFWRPASQRLVGSVLRKVPGHDLGKVRSMAKARDRHIPFLDAMMPNQAGPVYSRDDLERAARRLGLDAVVVGSDQVWRPDYIEDIDTASFFLDLPGDIRKISYAASFGKSEWTAPHRLGEVRRLLAGFDAVSLRESSGVDLCREVLGRRVCTQTLDPTLLVDARFYDEIIGPGEDRAPYVLNYALDPSAGAKAVLSGDFDGPAQGLDVRTLTLDDGADTMDVPSWLRAFRDAAFVVTDSFHGTVFSILFQKPFVCFGNQSRGMDRFTSLLSLLGLEDRLVLEAAALAGLEAEIDYGAVLSRLAEHRAASAAFLEGALAPVPVDA